MPSGVYKHTHGFKKGHHPDNEFQKGHPSPKYWLGKKMSIDHRKKMSEARKGDKNPLWKGGVSPKYKLIRMGIDFRLWREAVFARDNWTCQDCKMKGVFLHPHHIKSFIKYPELRFAIDNGKTLCKKCHGKVHNKHFA